MAIDLINIQLNSEGFLINLYRFLLGFVVFMHTLFLWKSGIRFNKKNNYFFSPPFPFIKLLPLPLHNAILYLLPLAGLLIMINNAYAAIGCFIAAIILIYFSLFCYSAWHHDLFLSTLILFLSGMYFAFPQPVLAKKFITLIIFQISLVYFFSGLAKLNSSLIKSDLLTESLINPYRDFMLKNKWIIKPYKWLAIITEIAFGFIFWIPLIAVQKVAIIVGALFHTGIIFMTGRGRTFHSMLPITYLLVIVRNLPSYERDIILFLIFIFVPILSTIIFFPDGTRY